jgi:hypothetical protein
MPAGVHAEGERRLEAQARTKPSKGQTDEEHGAAAASAMQRDHDNEHGDEGTPSLSGATAVGDEGDATRASEESAVERD